MASDGETWCANDPNFAVSYSFLKVFGKLYGLEVPTIAKLQEFIEDTQEVSDTLKELHLRLLRRALRSVHSNRWEKGMIKFCHQQGHHQEAWEIERFSYKKASTQVKLKVLKILLEYQFTCHPKFKSAVNAISCKELRLDPIGRDQNGCAYWLQVDHDANICLYKEDQDEETWQLIARNREELVKVIGQLKSGEEISPSQTSNANEDSSGAENHVQESQAKPESHSQKPEVEDDENEEEFLSPESESEHEETEQKDPLSDLADGNETNVESSDPLDSNDAKVESKEPAVDEQIEKKEADNEYETKDITETQTEIENTQLGNDNENNIEQSEAITDDVSEQLEDELLRSPESEQNEENIEPSETNSVGKADDTTEASKNEIDETHANPVSEIDTKVSVSECDVEISDEIINSPKLSETSKDSESILEDDKDSTIEQGSKSEENLQNEVSEAIEDPVMLVTGEGNGEDCESFFLGEEISEPVMFFYGEGYGYENDTGNPEAIEETNQVETEGENGKEEVVNGEHEVVKTKSKLSKNVRLKTVNKRSLKKQSNDTNEAKPDSKKPCVRDTDKSHNSKVENCLKREANVNDKSTTDSESPRKNNVKKGRSKVKKKALTRKLKLKRNGGKDAINSVETDNCQDKTSIIEKRKSSVSSIDQDENATENEKEKTPDKELKVEDPLPTKKIRLETTPESDINATHSKDVVSESIEKDNSNHDTISKRKKIKASKGKFKRKPQKNQDVDKSNDIDKVNDSSKKSNKSLKRTLIAEPVSDKNKSESQSESADDEPITSGKRLKIKPKKIITSSRKKVEAKLLEKHSSDESEEETLYSLAGKKSTKKLMKKKPKGKSKDKDKKAKSKSDKGNSEDSDAPVRQSRRIAQQKIKEEAERRHQEEVALRELKMIHKKKTKDDDEDEWRASGRSSSEAEVKRKHRRTWHCSDSTDPEPDSESDSPLFDLQAEAEPEHDYGKSDHEFSPESDLEGGESPEPLKRARTLREEKDDGFCKRCGSAEQPEWILLCDRCDAGYHASCLKPMLFVVPEGDWFCPPCNHEKLIKTLESELVKYDELLSKVEEERARKKLEEPKPAPEEEKPKPEVDSDVSSDSSWSSSSSDAAVYRLRARRQLPVSVRSQEYDRIISAAIKEEYVEPTTSAGNQGRGKDISTIIEAAEEEKMKAEREAIEQGKPVDLLKKLKKKQRRKPRKLNSLEVPSEDDDETDEDFKDVGGASSSEDISSSADKESGSSSSDSLPIRRTGRTDKKERPKMTESSPEARKKKKVFEDSSSESAGAKEWNNSKPKPKSHSHSRPRKREKRDKSRKKKSRGLTQYDAEGNVIRARVTYGGLSDGDGENDWSPKHRTRQKKINYTEMPNTESEDEMHKSSGKHMPDSSDEFKCSDSELDTDSDAGRRKRKEEEVAEREKALSDLVKKTAVVPLEKLPEDVTKAKTEELQAHLNAQQASARPARGKGSRGGRGSRGPRGRGGGGGGRRSSGPRAGSPQTDDALAKLVGVKIKELGQDGSPVKASQLEREKKRQEREAKLAEKEAKKLERIQKKEEKEKLKELKAKEREEKRVARIALQESKRIKKEKEYMGPMGGYGLPVRPLGAESPRVNNMNMFNHMRPARPPAPTGPAGPDPPDRFPTAPRLQVRAELRGVVGDHRAGLTREGTLSVAGSPQPFKPVSEEPSIITRMPHMINQQYRGPMMYGGGAGGAGYAARAGAPAAVYGLPGLRYPHYYRLPPYAAPAGPHQQHHQHHQPHQPHQHHQPPLYSHMQGPGGPPPPPPHAGQGALHHSGGYYRAAPPGALPPGAPSPAGSPMPAPGPHAPALQHHMAPHNAPGGPFVRSPGPSQSPSSGAPTPPGALNAAPGGLPPNSMPPRPLGMPGGPPGAPGGPPAPPAGPSAPGSQAGQDPELPIRIKAEVKTEPEYRSPVASPGAGSPGEPREEPPRHPKIKVTEVRERRPRFPLGPYAPHLASYRPYAPPLHPGPGPGHHPPGPSPHPGQNPLHPGSSSHPGGSHHPGSSSHPGQSPHHPSSHHPGSNAHPRPGSHHPGPSPHHPGQSAQHPGSSTHHPGQSPHPTAPSPHHATQSPHNSAPSPHHPGPSSHPGPGSHHQGQNAHHPGQSPHQPGLNTHHPGQSQQPGPSSHSGPLPQRPGQSPQHPGPSPHHPGQSPHHPGPGPAPHHPGQSLNHPGQNPSHQGPSPHPLLRDPTQFKTERDQSPSPSGAEERPYQSNAVRLPYAPPVRSPFSPGGPYPPGGPNSYPPSAAGAYPPGNTGPYAGVSPGPYPGARFASAGRGFPPGVRPFPPQFSPRPHVPAAQPIPAHTNPIQAQPPQAKSPLAAPPRAPSHSPHAAPAAPVKAGRGSMPFPARAASPGAGGPGPVYSPKPRSPHPVDRSPPYYDRRPVSPPQQTLREPAQEENGSPSRVPQQRLESLEAAPSPGAESPPRVKVEREEEGVFGGLVSYFSSQHEDDMDG